MLLKSATYLAIGYVVTKDLRTRTIVRNKIEDPMVAWSFRAVIVGLWPVLAVAKGIDKIQAMRSK